MKYTENNYIYVASSASRLHWGIFALISASSSELGDKLAAPACISIKPSADASQVSFMRSLKCTCIPSEWRLDNTSHKFFRLSRWSVADPLFTCCCWGRSPPVLSIHDFKGSSLRLRRNNPEKTPPQNAMGSYHEVWSTVIQMQSMGAICIR
jgi:hypothetical protein